MKRKTDRIVARIRLHSRDKWVIVNDDGSTDADRVRTFVTHDHAVKHLVEHAKHGAKMAGHKQYTHFVVQIMDGDDTPLIELPRPEQEPA